MQRDSSPPCSSSSSSQPHSSSRFAREVGAASPWACRHCRCLAAWCGSPTRLPRSSPCCGASLCGTAQCWHSTSGGRSVFVADCHVAHEELIDRSAALAHRPALVSVMFLGENNNTITRASYGSVRRLLRCNLVAVTLLPSRVKLFRAGARLGASRARREAW